MYATGADRNKMIANDISTTSKLLKKYFPIMKGLLIDRKVGDIKAIDGMSLDIFQGETLGLVGESGCGKSTTGYAILYLDKPTEGQILFDNIDLASMNNKELRKLRPRPNLTKMFVKI